MAACKIMIVEDELLVAYDLAERLKQAGYEIVGISDNMEQAISMFKQYLPDLVLLDITIKGKHTGIDIAYAITELQPTPFIYITAHADAATVNNAKNTFPAAYVIKPFNTNSLLVSIELALHNFAYRNEPAQTTAPGSENNFYLKQNHIFIKDGHKFIKLFLNDIVYASADDNYIKITTAEKPYLVRTTLSRFLEILNNGHFIRIHRSYCVNTRHITAFSENEITAGNTVIPVGRNYKQELTHIFTFKR